MKCSEITYKKVSELVLLPENPRTITKNDFERLVDSIKINGFWKHDLWRLWSVTVNWWCWQETNA